LLIFIYLFLSFFGHSEPSTASSSSNGRQSPTPEQEASGHTTDSTWFQMYATNAVANNVLGSVFLNISAQNFNDVSFLLMKEWKE
jgi:hypothetical protein